MQPALIAFLLAGVPIAALAQFVPADFAVPTSYEGKTYKLVPLDPKLVKLDYDAYMSSIDHIRRTTGENWPTANVTMQDAIKDLVSEKAQWDGRKSFPFAVLTPDGSREIGCFYLRPSAKQGYDAVATLWVTREQFDKGFEKKLYADMRAWVAKSWPFRSVAWPGHSMTHAQWKALPDKQK